MSDHQYFISLSTPTLAVQWDACESQPREWIHLHRFAAGSDVATKIAALAGDSVSVKLYPPDQDTCLLYTGHLADVREGELGGRPTTMARITCQPLLSGLGHGLAR